MTTIHAANLHLLKTQYLLDRLPSRALSILEREPAGESRFLRRLLRHHNEAAVVDQAEIRARDSFDFLLAYFGLLEIATLADFVPVTLPAEEWQHALRVLNQPNVREYYTEKYPVLLPMLYRLRVERGKAPFPNGPGAIPLFQQFLGIVDWQRADADMDTFLWFLDSGSWGECDIAGLVEVLAKPEAYAASILKSSRSLTPLDRGVIGYGKFLSLCLMLESLLVEARHWPLFQSAMYHYYAYWLDSLRRNVKKVLDPTLKAMLRWNVEQGSNLIDHARRDLREAHNQVARLLAARYASPLLQAQY